MDWKIRLFKIYWDEDDVAATLGLSQLHEHDKMVELRRQNARLLNGKLSRLTGIITPDPQDTSIMSIRCILSEFRMAGEIVL